MSSPFDRVKYKAGFIPMPSFNVYIIGGNRDKLKDLMAHISKTLSPQSVRLLLAFNVTHWFNVWYSDIRKDYLQESEPFDK